MPRAILGGYFPARRCDTLGDRQSTRGANRALHVSVTHSRHNLRRLPKDERRRQRERSMRPVILGTLKAIKALSCEVCRCGFRVPGVTLASVRMPAASGPIVSVAFCGWGGGRSNLWRHEEADRWEWFTRTKLEFNTESPLV
jgi:hypothetical protein